MENEEKKCKQEKEFLVAILLEFALVFASLFFGISMLELFTTNIACFSFLDVVLFALGFLVLILFDIILSYYLIWKSLICITYSYANLYLFRKYSFFHEILFVVALTFLLGAFPAIFEYIGFENKTIIFYVNISTIWFGCFVAGTKCIIDYDCLLWDTKAKKKSKKLQG